jgi:hypothetical protein
VKNKKGQRVLNIDVMRELETHPKPHVLEGVKVVQTSQ